MAQQITTLTPIDPFPSRVLPQDRFDQAVRTNMSQLSDMVAQLNSDFIPDANALATEVENNASTASTKATQAANSATTATNKASEATTAASTATTKASQASTSATNAANSASAAAQSAQQAEDAATNTVKLTGNQTVSGNKTFTGKTTVANVTSDADNSNEPVPVSFFRDHLRAEMERISGGRNTVIYDSFGYPHVMVVIPRFRLEDIDASLGSGDHPAFTINGQLKSEIFIGKYIASKGSDNRAKTLARKEPWHTVNFDAALTACRALGSHFSLVSNTIWSARVLWLYKLLGGSHVYKGNTNYGRDYTDHYLTGTLINTSYLPGDTANGSARTLTGTGPVEWTDDETPWGICDLTGNVWEWVAGLRGNNGEINVIPNGDSMLSTCDMSASSSAWRAFLQDGSLVTCGTANTLKYDGISADTKTSWQDAGQFKLNTSIVNANNKGFYSIDFKNLTAASGVTVPNILKQYGVMPIANTVQGHMWMQNSRENLAYRGGDWDGGLGAGPFALRMLYPRTTADGSLGFRVAYYS